MEAARKAPRPYRMQRRAESEAATRRRITESAVELHGTLGPSRTTLSAVAAHAGVRRSTLYRHFEDEAALFDACSAHWAAQHPPPSLEAWAVIEDPDVRLEVALGELYAFYGRTERMLDNLLRDEDVVPLVKERFAAFRALLAAARDVLLAGRTLDGPGRDRVAAVLGHAVAFSTWRSLVREQGLSGEDAVALMGSLVAAASRDATA